MARSFFNPSERISEPVATDDIHEDNGKYNCQDQADEPAINRNKGFFKPIQAPLPDTL